MLALMCQLHGIYYRTIATKKEKKPYGWALLVSAGCITPNIAGAITNIIITLFRTAVNHSGPFRAMFDSMIG